MLNSLGASTFLARQWTFKPRLGLLWPSVSVRAAAATRAVLIVTSTGRNPGLRRHQGSSALTFRSQIIWMKLFWPRNESLMNLARSRSPGKQRRGGRPVFHKNKNARTDDWAVGGGGVIINLSLLNFHPADWCRPMNRTTCTCPQAKASGPI